MTIETYLEERNRPAASDHPMPVVRLGRKLVPPGLRYLAKLAVTRAVTPREVRRARALEATHTPLNLHLGCGARILPGWVNVDLYASGAGADLNLDLTKRLPFSDDSVDAIFHEHVLEHFKYPAALRLTRECARVLKPGGVLRIGVPDFGSYARSYAGDGKFVEKVRGGRPSKLLALAEVVYDHGHASMWDGETLALLLSEAGLTPGSERLGPGLDSPNRIPESVYVEGVKPEPDGEESAGL